MPTTPFSLGSTQSDTIRFLWDPSRLTVSKPKTRFLVHVHSMLLDSSQHFDTTIIVDVSSFANQPVVSLSDTAVHFDSINICQGIVDTTVTFTNGGCDTLHLTAIDILGSSDWEVLAKDGSTLQLPMGIPRDSTGMIRIRFKPSTTNAQQGSIVLHFIEKGVTKDTTIFIKGSSYRTLSVFVDRSLTLPATSICIYRDSSVTIRNNSCDTLIIDSLTNINGLSFQLLSTLTLPYRLAPNEVLQIPFRFFPHKDTSQVTRFEFTYHIQNEVGRSSTTIVGKGIPGEAQFVTTLQQSLIKFADRLSCTPPDSVSFYIFNPGCDSLTVTSVTLGGVSIPALSYSVASQLPKILVAGKDSLRIVLKVNGTTASNNNGLISIRFVRPDSSMVDTTFNVEALIAPAARVASLQHYLFDFGTLPLCIAKFDTVIIRNDACPLLTVNSISIAGSDYMVIKQPTFPLFLSQNQSDILVVQLIPTQNGVRSATLSVSTDADVNPLKNVFYTANIQPIDKVSFRVEQVNKDIVTADSAMIDIIPDIDWKGKGLETLGFSLAYNSDLLSYAKTLSFSSTITTFVSTVVLPNGDEQLNVHITSPDEIVLQRDFPLLRFYFTTALTDTIKTPVLLTQLQLNDGDNNYKSCVLAPSATGYYGEFILNLVCGDKTIRDYMTGKTILFAKAAHPDPINTTLSSSISFPFTVAQSGDVVFSVYSELGNLMFRDKINIIHSGDYEFSVPASKLTGGAFNYVISYTGVTRGQVRGRFIVLH